MAKIFAIGCPHFRATNPINRVDKFFEAQLTKFTWCLILAESYDCDAIIIPGDVFDMPFVGNYCLSRVFNVIAGTDIPIFVIYGQHDLYFRSKKRLEKTSLKVAESAGSVEVLGSEPIYLYEKNNKVAIYGASTDEPIPAIKDENEKNVLVIHTMISNIEEPFKYRKPKNFKKYGYDIVISGDNHKSFSAKLKSGMLLVNPGTMSRQKVNEANYKPTVALIDTYKADVKMIRIKPVLPPEVVFRTKPVPEVGVSEEDFSEEIEKLIAELGDSDWDPVDPAIILEKHIEGNRHNIRPGAINKLEECAISLREK